jgi:hypothetical protein
VRDWVSVGLAMPIDRAEKLGAQDFQPIESCNHPRTLRGMGFSVFGLDRLAYFMSILAHPRKRTLKTISGNALRLPLLKSLGNEGIY